MIYPDWPVPANVQAVTTTRQAGVSGAPYHSLNLADHVGDDARFVEQNRLLVEQRLKLPRQPVWLSQVHGNTVVDVALSAQRPAADAGFTTRANVVCAVLTADCLPVLFCDRKGTRVAATHAGWRGLAGGVLENCVTALDGDPGQLLAWLGPAIGPEAFEVGEEVRQAFVTQNPLTRAAFAVGQQGRWLADLYRLARIRLQAIGVTAVYGGGYCTYADAQRFYSYRRDGVTGRMASLIWLVRNGVP